MKLLKTILGNALVLSTVVTVLAGTVLVSYTDKASQADLQTPGLTMKFDEGVPQNMVTADATRGSTRTREADEGTPPGMMATLSIPSGTIIDGMI
jgi:hypothetical protein